MTFAFAGTFISACTLGVILFIWSLTPFEALNISFVEAISVGATLSATDPVTILAIFNAYKVDPKLYTIIFGESILNDAVAIVMFETARQFHSTDEATIASLFKGIGVFLVVFFVSLLIGVLVGIATALLLKHTYMRRFPGIESCFILLVAYASYLFSNGCHMSGTRRTVVPRPPNPANPLYHCRNCIAPLLRHHAQALRLLQHVSPHPTYH